MTIKPLPLYGAAEICSSPVEDARGWFARLFCQKELFSLNEGRPIQQVNCSFSVKRGLVRGLHFQKAPRSEDRAVRCIVGRVFDVMVDLRENSSTFGCWHAVILDSTEMNMVYIPRGFAHGFQTLEDNCQMLYLHTGFYAPETEGGIHYDSPALGVEWPLPVTEVSQRDETLPHFEPSFGGDEL